MNDRIDAAQRFQPSLVPTIREIRNDRRNLVARTVPGTDVEGHDIIAPGGANT